jgi:DNA-binding response OmpR family regulator
MQLCTCTGEKRGRRLTRIAVIEDDFELSRLMRDVLRESGHEVVSFMQPSGDTVQHLEEYKPDLVVLDLRLNSSVTGWDVISAMREDPTVRSVPIVVVSGAEREVEANAEWLRSHDVRVLLKPFDIADLESMVGSLLPA